jgi:predicted glycosyl hydrolase (DUF1957 family)
MWVRADVEAFSGREHHWSQMIEKNKRPDFATFRVRQHTTDFEIAKVPGARLDNEVDGSRHGTTAFRPGRGKRGAR